MILPKGADLSDSDLLAFARMCFEKGHHAKIRQEYNSAILKNMAGVAGRFVTMEEAFDDFLKTLEACEEKEG